MTKQEQTLEVVKTISNCADFGISFGIINETDLVRYHIEQGDMTSAMEMLDNIDKAAERVATKMEQNYHAFEMLKHFACAMACESCYPL